MAGGRFGQAPAPEEDADRAGEVDRRDQARDDAGAGVSPLGQDRLHGGLLHLDRARLGRPCRTRGGQLRRGRCDRGLHQRGNDNGTSEKFKPGTLSKWKTAKNIHLGSQKAAVKRAYPAAKANTSTGVNGFDLFSTGPGGLNVTHFSSFGVGPSATRLRYIQLACYNNKC